MDAAEPHIKLPLGKENFKYLNKLKGDGCMALESFRIINGYLSSNLNRASIIHLLRNAQSNEMQVERMANCLGVSHRTVRYHLEILHRHGIVEVRKFNNRGLEMVKSVWGLNTDNEAAVHNLFEKVSQRYNKRTLSKATNCNKKRR